MKILFATDGSPCSEVALQEACRLLPVQGAEALVVSVVDPLVYAAGFEGMAPGTAVVLEREFKAAEADLAKARLALEAAGLEVTTQEAEGDPAGKILEAAEDFQPDVIVVGSHGRGPLGRLVLGSVSDQVVHRWPGAVLVIRPRE